MTIRVLDSKRDRLRRPDESHGVRLNKIVDEWASMALTQFDAETRFRALGGRGDGRRGLALLDKLDVAAKPRVVAPNGRKGKR